MSTFDNLHNHFERVARAVAGVNLYEVEKACLILSQVRKLDAAVWLIGNGGSAATCAHFANDLEKMCGVRAIPVPELTAMVTAHGNDEGWENMFSKVIQRNAGVHDVVVALSCSGNSPNVVRVADDHAYNELIVFTGNDPDCKLARIRPSALIMVPDDDIKVQEDVHLAICHAMAGVLSK